MPNSDKNIVITPARGAAADPTIVFSGANASVGPQNITVTALPLANGTLSFSGSAGQLFSVTNSLSGSIFSVNDVSGIPSIEVFANGQVQMASFGGNVRIGTDLSVVGNITAASVVGALSFTTQANTAPSNPRNGDFWYNSTTDIKYQYINDGDSAAWVDQSFPTSFGTLTAQNIVNGGTPGTGNIGSAPGPFNTVFARATSAQYADLAEMYVADADYAPGTLVEFGGLKEVTLTTESHSTAVAGVVSTAPSFLMNYRQEGRHVAAVSLTGRVPCSVVGTISKGDRLVSSDVPGVAQALDPAQYQPGAIIGKALEAYDSTLPGTIEIAVGRY